MRETFVVNRKFPACLLIPHAPGNSGILYLLIGWRFKCSMGAGHYIYKNFSQEISLNPVENRSYTGIMRPDLITGDILVFVSFMFLFK